MSATHEQLVVTEGAFDSDGRPAGLWLVDYLSGDRCAEILFNRVTSRQLWYEDGTPAACYATDRTGELNGPLVRWHRNGSLWEQAAFGNNEEVVGTHHVYYEDGSIRAKGYLQGASERYEFWHANGRLAAQAVNGELSECVSDSGDAISPAEFLARYGGTVVDVMEDLDHKPGMHLQGPSENAHELDDAVTVALIFAFTAKRARMTGDRDGKM